MYYVLEHFGFILELTNPDVVELSIFIVVSGCYFPKENYQGYIPNPYLGLLNVPVVSNSASEVTKLLIVLRFVRVGPLYHGVGLWGLSPG